MTQLVGMTAAITLVAAIWLSVWAVVRSGDRNTPQPPDPDHNWEWYAAGMHNQPPDPKDPNQ